MANREACELYIEQEINEGLSQGKTPHRIGKELAAMIEQLFETKMPPETIRTRARAIKTKTGDFTTTPINSQNNSENLNNQVVLTSHGGKGEGSGAPQKYPAPPAQPEPWSCALQMAGLAIGHLGRIPLDDPKRRDALAKVATWINTQLKEICECHI